MLIRLAVLALLLVSGCATYTGGAVDVQGEALRREPGWVLLEDVPIVRQHGNTDCGAAALTMVLQYLGDATTLEQVLAELGRPPEEALRAGDLRDLAKQRGFESFLFSGEDDDFEKHLRKGRPLIVGLVKPTLGKPISHYEVVVGYHPERRMVATLDPARGWRQNVWPEFLTEWVPTQRLALVVVPQSRP